jgi:hypothetical protein
MSDTSTPNTVVVGRVVRSDGKPIADQELANELFKLQCRVPALERENANQYQSLADDLELIGHTELAERSRRADKYLHWHIDQSRKNYLALQSRLEAVTAERDELQHKLNKPTFADFVQDKINEVQS